MTRRNATRTAATPTEPSKAPRGRAARRASSPSPPPNPAKPVAVSATTAPTPPRSPLPPTSTPTSTPTPTTTSTLPLPPVHHTIDPHDGSHIFSSQFPSSPSFDTISRLDAFLTLVIPDITRSKVLHCIKDNLVTVNDKVLTKAGTKLKPGDTVTCRVPPPPPIEAIPEAIPLDIVYEDEFLLLVNKPAGMVVHPAPGLTSGTLVNALLHHCDLPPMRFVALGKQRREEETLPQRSLEKNTINDGDDRNEAIEQEQEGEEEEEEDHGDEEGSLRGAWTAIATAGPPPVIRPGIVHRIDKGTTGLLVCSKTDRAHTALCKQFEERTTRRVYWSITVGVPPEESGRITTNIERDARDFRRMTTAPYQGGKGRHAASNYRVLEVLARGGAALVEWKLETGRTHQIRVHAKHLGYPLFGDETYGGSGLGAAQRMAASGGSHRKGNRKEVAGVPSTLTVAARQTTLLGLLKQFQRPALHAKTLGFAHPNSGEQVNFSSQLAPDFATLLESLREM